MGLKNLIGDKNWELGLRIEIGIWDCRFELRIGIGDWDWELGIGNWDCGLGFGIETGFGIVDCDWGLFMTFGCELCCDFWL